MSRTMPKSEVTLLRVRQLVNDESAEATDFLRLLSRDELADMIFCATSFIYGMKTFLNCLGIDGEKIIGEIFVNVGSIDD